MSVGKNQAFIFGAGLMVCMGVTLFVFAKPLARLSTALPAPLQRLLRCDDPNVVFAKLRFNGVALAAVPIAAFILRFVLQAR